MHLARLATLKHDPGLQAVADPYKVVVDGGYGQQ